VEFAVGSGCRGVTPVSSPSVGSGVLGQRALHGRPSLCHARGASSDVTTDKRWSAKDKPIFCFYNDRPKHQRVRRKIVENVKMRKAKRVMHSH